KRGAPLHLGLAVGAVQRMRAEEQVIRVDAAPLVAAMAQHGALRDRAVADRPGIAVRELGAGGGDAQAAVAVRVRLALPDQAAGQRVAAGPLRQTLGGWEGEGRRGVVYAC